MRCVADKNKEMLQNRTSIESKRRCLAGSIKANWPLNVKVKRCSETAVRNNRSGITQCGLRHGDKSSTFKHLQLLWNFQTAADFTFYLFICILYSTNLSVNVGCRIKIVRLLNMGVSIVDLFQLLLVKHCWQPVVNLPYVYFTFKGHISIIKNIVWIMFYTL